MGPLVPWSPSVLGRGAFNTGAIGAMHLGPLQRRAPVWENSEL